MATMSLPASPVPPAVEATPTRQSIASRLTDVRRRIEAAGRDPDSLRIVAVTKGWTADVVEAARSVGLADVGENYAQELLAKSVGGSQGVRWHFLGPVQRNKVKRLAPVVASWHGIDRAVAADAVAAASPGVEVFVEVNLTGIPGRPGCQPEEVPALVEHCRTQRLDLSGLMTIAPGGDPAGARECFRWLAGSARQLGLPELSMGMSDDFEVAVQEGATTLRLGRVLFGSRPRSRSVAR
jgi:pyridoxal phosphate enzyme (YggS family)